VIALSAALRAQHMAEIGAALDAGRVRLYSGPQPATGAAITTEELLAEFVIQAWAISGDTLSLALSSTAGIANGEAVWARIVGSAGAHVLDGDCGITADAFVMMRSTTVQAGISIAATEATLGYGD